MELSFLYFHTSLNEMHIFLKYRTFEDIYYKLLLFLFLRILPNVPRLVHMLIIGSAPLPLHTFLFKGFAN